MHLWMSRSTVLPCLYSFWTVRPEVEWPKDDLPRIGIRFTNTEKNFWDVTNIHIMFPKLEIPPGEIAEVEVFEMENGYYISLVEGDDE